MTGSADELNRGYFDDMSELKQHGGKGMSDLLSPILFVMKDESESFWCFLALIERFGPNFNRDQNGMHSQLFALSKVSLSFTDAHSHTQTCLSDGFIMVYVKMTKTFFLVLNFGI
ncbi:GTPase-activating protein GYP7-like [Gossypium arboreum]|uniref:GTPase-activating protein GYP7-like n=1 Tax=Gossypium arboreum TaxID=29729 RepID=UPI0022F1A678|nr:GTPase-activating protein GYP7-like [Gossypium arboreum]